MNSPHEVIIRPIVTERSFDQMSLNKYSFEVARSAPKEEIASAVEALFNVHVKKVKPNGSNPRPSAFATSPARPAAGRRPSSPLLTVSR